MKSIKIYACGMIGLLVTVLLISCEKTFDEKTVQQTELNNSTVTQVFIATVNANRNYIYVDGAPVNGSTLATGNVFPATGFGFKVNPGLRAFQVRDTATVTTQVPLNFSSNMQVGKNHTIFLYDTITTPKQKTVTTDIVIPADYSSRIRFANFIYNPTAVPAVDVFSFKANANIFTNVPVTGVTDFISIPSRVTDTLYIRETGTLNQLLKVTVIDGVTAKRSYTYIYRGSHRGTRALSIFANY